MYRNRRGFTLLELLTVVLILGILSAIAVPQYNKSVRRAELVEGLANGRTLYDSATRFKAANGYAPTDLNQLDSAFIGSDSDGGTTLDDGAFVYNLLTDRVRVQSNRSAYYLDFMYPVKNDTGVFAPIACCVDNTATDIKTAQWLCQSNGLDPDDDTKAAVPAIANCRILQ